MEIDKTFSENYDRMKWRPVDGRELESRINGFTIIGSEPVDYPLTDGLTLFLQSPSGALFALDIATDLEDDNEPPLVIRMADISELYTQYREEYIAHEEHNNHN